MRLSNILRNRRGFSLLELAIVLTIVSLVLSGIWVAAAQVIQNNKAERFSEDAIQVIQNTKSLFAGQGASASTAGFSVPNAIAAGVFPSDMVAGSNVITPFSTSQTTQAFQITDGTPVTTLTYQFGLGTQGLPSGACAQLLINLGTLSNIQKLGISFLAGGPTPTTDLTNVGTAAVTVSAAGGACGGSGNGNFVAVTFSVI